MAQILKPMKTVAVILLALVACSKNDPKPVFDLAGKWSISSSTIIGNVTFKRSGNNLLELKDTTQHLLVYGTDYYYQWFFTSNYSGVPSYYSESSGYGNKIVYYTTSWQSNDSNLILYVYSGEASTDLNTIVITNYRIKKECTSGECGGGYVQNFIDTLTMTRLKD